MKLKLENFRKNTLAFMRDCGYAPIERNAAGELNCVRPLMGRDYPRFHCYVKEDGTNLLLNLHLDQKKPSYAGSSAHSGEYEGEVVETEAARIRQLFQKSL